MADQEGAPAPELEGLEIRGLLGRGVTSRVYLATQRKFSRPVALKVLDSADLASGPTELLADEARFTALLSAHPNILTLYDAGVTADGLTYLVTEYLPAGSLGQQLRSEGPLEESEVIQIGVQLAGALESSHLHGVVHGDVKPDNVLTGRDGRPVLADFGVAVMLSRSVVAEQALLTPLHAAPELFRGEPASVAADIYSLGSTLMELCSGRSPVGSHEDTPATVVARVEQRTRRPLEPGEAGSELAELLGWLTAVEAGERPASAAVVGENLRALQVSRSSQPTDMVVIDDLLEAAPGPDEPADIPAVEVTVPPPHDSDDGVDGIGAESSELVPEGAPGGEPGPPPRRWLVSAGVLGAVCVVVAIAVALWPKGEGVSRTADGDDAEALDGDTTQVAGGRTPDPDAGGSVTTVAPSGVAGIQPGIDYDAAGEDTSGELATILDEEALIFAPIPAVAAESPYYGRLLHTLPASFRYRGYNSLEPPRCRGMMSRPMTVTGLWERSAIWPGGVLLVAVADMADSQDAHEMATVLSMELGVEPADCHGMGKFNVDDYSDYGVEHRDVDELMPAGVGYNLWVEHDLQVGSKVWGKTVRLIVEVDHRVVDVSLATDIPLSGGNEAAVGEVANQIRTRLLRT